jgi:predicted small metal-binding protein
MTQRAHEGRVGEHLIDSLQWAAARVGADHEVPGIHEWSDEMKEIACGDIVPGCEFKASAETEEALLKKVAAHAKEAHGVDVTPELAAQVRAKIKDT